MTHPNLFRSGALLAATLCSTGPVTTSPDIPRHLAVNVAVGDTLVYTIGWGAGSRATSYDVTRSVTATNGVWSVVGDSQAGGGKATAPPGSVPLPNTFNTGSATTIHRMWVTSSTPWDSGTFTVTVVSRNAAGTSAPASASWQVKRKPGPPGPITIDSSLIMTGLFVAPPRDSMVVGQTHRFCAFQKFATGAVVEATPSRPMCDSLYAAYVPLASRGLVTAAQQAQTDTETVTWKSSDTTVARIQ